MSRRVDSFLIATAFVLFSTELSAANTSVTRTGPAYATRCRLLLCSTQEVIGIEIGSRQYPVPEIIEGAGVRGDGKCEAGPGALMEDRVIVKSKDGKVSFMSADAYVFECRAN